MKQRRNPGLVDDLVIGGAVFGSLYLLAKNIGRIQVGLGIPNATQAASNAFNSLTQSAGQEINSLAGTSIVPGGLSDAALCQSIAVWKHNQVVFNPFHLLFPPADPNDWNAFRSYAKQPIIGLGMDPGEVPPTCWFNADVLNGNAPFGGSGAAQGVYEGQRPGGLGY